LPIAFVYANIADSLLVFMPIYHIADSLLLYWYSVWVSYYHVPVYFKASFKFAR